MSKLNELIIESLIRYGAETIISTISNKEIQKNLNERFHNSKTKLDFIEFKLDTTEFSTDILPLLEKHAKKGIDIFINLDPAYNNETQTELVKSSVSGFINEYKNSFTSVVDLTNQISKEMNRDGSIIFVYPPYNCNSSSQLCTNTSLAMFAKTAALDLGKKAHIRVNAIKVGYIEQYSSGTVDSSVRFTSFESISNMLLFLSSDLSKDITGTEQVVDSGSRL